LWDISACIVANLSHVKCKENLQINREAHFTGFTCFLGKASDYKGWFGEKNKMCREVSGFVGCY